MNSSTPALDAQLLSLCKQGKKLEAVKLCKDTTGLGLKESKDYVEDLCERYENVGYAHDISSVKQNAADTTFDKQLINLCQQNRKLEAIKLYKDTTGEGLKESKDYIDELCRYHQNGRIENTDNMAGTNLGKCFIATACYGSYDAPEVLVLRNFRDEKLLTTYSGTLLVKLYYTVSPILARRIEESDRLKHLVRKLLQPLIRMVK